MRLNRLAILCFLAVYIIWGSTYLAIRYAIESMPAFGMSSARFFIAAFILYLMSVWKKELPLEPQEKKISLLSGAFLIMANGFVCVVEYWVPSSIVAIMIGAMPIWIMLMGWLAFNQSRPPMIRILGGIIGLSGVALIAFSDVVPTVSGMGKFGTLILMGSSCLWAAGTLIQRKVKSLKSVLRFSSLQMLSGAVTTGVTSLLFEKPWQLNFSALGSNSIWAFFYLVFFGSIVAFTAYSWLSRNVEAHLVSTYALVNPVIAVILGSLFFHEPLTYGFLSSSILVIIGLSLIIVKTDQLERLFLRPKKT